MQKLSEISLGQKKGLVRSGSLFVVFLLGIIFFLGFYIIKIPVYADVEIIASENKIFLISGVDLKQPGKIELENNLVFKVTLEKIGLDKYKIKKEQLSPTLVQKLERNILTSGKILVGKQNFFKSIFPF